MKKRILDSLKAHPVMAAFGAAVLLYVVSQFGAGIVEGVRSKVFSGQVSAVEREAGAAEAQAQAAIQDAAAAEIDRRVEDRIREQTIKQEIARASEVVTATRSRSREAETNYEHSQKTFSRAGLNDVALRERNCTDLAELYPGKRFSFCK